MEYDRIKSPTSGRLIYIGGDAYNKLLSTYSPEYLNTLPRVKTNTAPKSPKTLKALNTITPVNNNPLVYKGIYALNNDIYTNLLLNANPNDVDQLCQSNTQFYNLCDEGFWKAKINMDYPMVHLKSTNYKQEYHTLTKLYDMAQNVLKVIQLYKEDHLDFRIIGFIMDDKGFNKLDEIYWLPHMTKELSNAQRMRIEILSTTRYHYYISLINTTTLMGPKIPINENDVLNTFWLLMYHYHIDIINISIEGKSFLYDRILTMKGKYKKEMLRYWNQVFKK